MAGSNRARAHKRAKRQAQASGDILARCGAILSRHGLQIDIDKLDQVFALALQGCAPDQILEIQQLVMANPASYRQLRDMGIPQQASPVEHRAGPGERLHVGTLDTPPLFQMNPDVEAENGLMLGVPDEEYEDLVLGGAPPPAPAQSGAGGPIGTRATRRGVPTQSLQDKLVGRLANSAGVNAQRGRDGAIHTLKLSKNLPPPPAAEEPMTAEQLAEETRIAQRLVMRGRAGQPKPRVR